jgi:hypothetical protein
MIETATFSFFWRQFALLVLRKMPGDKKQELFELFVPGS